MNHNTSSRLADFLEFAKPVCFYELTGDTVTLHLLGKTKNTILMEDLAAYDERLPAFLKVSARPRKSYAGAVGVYGANVDDTVQLWLDCSTRVYTTKGGEVVIHSINTMRKKKSHLVLSGMFTKVFARPLDVNGVTRNVETVSEQDSNAITMSYAYLDEKYPGWAQRWAVIESLDLQSEERVRYLFNPTNTPNMLPVSLPLDVTL